MAENRHAPLSFRPAVRVARDEQFDESLFDRAAGPAAPREDARDSEEAPPAREGLPPSYRMRHDTHYVDQLASRRHAEPVHLLPIGEIDGPHPVVAPHELQPLVESIAAVGVLQPLLVRRHNSRYQLIAGTRRLAAAMAAGLAEVPCLVHVAGDERALALAEAEAVTSHQAVERAPQGETPSAIPAGVFADITEHLGAIGACLHLFGDRDRPLRERVALGLVQAEVQRAAWLSQALAVLAADPVVVANPVDITSLVRRLLATLTPERMLAGVEIEYEPALAPCFVRGDEQLLAVAMAGLVATVHALVERAQGASARIRVLQEGSAGAVRVEVSQEMVTLPASWRARFFELTWPDRPGGASVGACLAAARRIAELHGGTVHLGAPESGGCVLTLALPSEGRG